MIVDAHQHLWKLDRADYQWLTKELAPIYRDFLPDDLKPFLDKSGVDGTILVQATDTEAETEYLLSLADKHAWILGIVGWVDMESNRAPERIRQFATHSKFVGIRPMIQGIEDDRWMLKPALSPAVETLIDLNLTFDALVLPRHLKPLKEFVSRYDGLKVIIDHGAKPEIRNSAWEPWASEIAEIAALSDAYCKLSGLVTEAAAHWKEQDIEPYAKHILTVFGAERTVFGSDWPVLNLAGNYAQWMTLARDWVCEHDRHNIFGGNALRFYFGQDKSQR